jgi:hypothetical protein
VSVSTHWSISAHHSTRLRRAWARRGMLTSRRVPSSHVPGRHPSATHGRTTGSPGAPQVVEKHAAACQVWVGQPVHRRRDVVPCAATRGDGRGGGGVGGGLQSVWHPPLPCAPVRKSSRDSLFTWPGRGGGSTACMTANPRLQTRVLIAPPCARGARHTRTQPCRWRTSRTHSPPCAGGGRHTRTHHRVQVANVTHALTTVCRWRASHTHSPPCAGGARHARTHHRVQAAGFTHALNTSHTHSPPGAGGARHTHALTTVCRWQTSHTHSPPCAGGGLHTRTHHRVQVAGCTHALTTVCRWRKSNRYSPQGTPAQSHGPAQRPLPLDTGHSGVDSLSWYNPLRRSTGEVVVVVVVGAGSNRPRHSTPLLHATYRHITTQPPLPHAPTQRRVPSPPPSSLTCTAAGPNCRRTGARGASRRPRTARTTRRTRGRRSRAAPAGRTEGP